MKKKIIFTLFLFLISCGDGTDNSYLNPDSPQPVVISASPSSAKPGSSIQIQGVGFSPVVNQNIVLVAGTSSSATDFSLVANPSASQGATDQISFVLPDSVVVGETTLSVLVAENPSNAITFTVESP